jgi:hypothetical protein
VQKNRRQCTKLTIHSPSKRLEQKSIGQKNETEKWKTQIGGIIIRHTINPLNGAITCIAPCIADVQFDALQHNADVCIAAVNHWNKRRPNLRLLNG